jgi:hypothetical protein
MEGRLAIVAAVPLTSPHVVVAEVPEIVGARPG